MMGKYEGMGWGWIWLVILVLGLAALVWGLVRTHAFSSEGGDAEQRPQVMSHNRAQQILRERMRALDGY